MKLFIITLFTLFMMMAMNTGEWFAYLLTLTGFLVMLKLVDDLEENS